MCCVRGDRARSSLLSGIISDRLGGRRKIVVYVSSIMMAVSSILFAVTRSYTLDMGIGLVSVGRARCVVAAPLAERALLRRSLASDTARSP